MAGSRVIPHVASKVIIPRQTPRAMPTGMSTPAAQAPYKAPQYVPTGHPSVSAPSAPINFATPAYAPKPGAPSLVGNKAVSQHAQAVNAALYGVAPGAYPAYLPTYMPLPAGAGGAAGGGAPASAGGGGGGAPASTPTPDSTPTLQSQPGASSQALATVPPAPLATVGPTLFGRPRWQVLLAGGLAGLAVWWFFLKKPSKKQNPFVARARRRRGR